NNYSNVYNFLGILEDVLRGTGYYFNIDEELYEKQRVELNRRGYKGFAILDLKYIINNYIRVLYLDKAKSKPILLKYINSVDEWIDEADKDKYDIGNIAEVWAK
ncbi:hypothetical protein, partial [Clostridium sp. DJ247]|uniref:hypothetical protein n=1 Tax=Clostridium sp. DJ247 TaxID=2726188 RepID=UPI00162A0999